MWFSVFYREWATVKIGQNSKITGSLHNLLLRVFFTFIYLNKKLYKNLTKPFSMKFKICSLVNKRT